MSEIDISDLKKEALDKGNFPVGSKVPFRVHFAPEVHEGTRAHASADTSVEICGVLVGKWETDNNGPYALITNYIRCDNAAQKHAEVTFTQDSWTQINHEMDTKYQDLRIIGWYHSHPDFGIFLSDRDCFIQQHFFSGPGQVAFVIDPVRHLEGLFEWRNGKPTAMHHYWVGEQIHLGETRPAEKQAPKPGTMEDSEAGEAPESSMLPAGPTEGILNWIVVALACVCAFLLGMHLSNNSYFALLQRAEIQLIDNYELYKVRGLGLEDGLDRVQQDLQALATIGASIADISSDESRKEDLQSSVAQLQQGLVATYNDVERVKVMYGHNPEQQRRYEQLRQQYLDSLKKAADDKAAAPSVPDGTGETPVVRPQPSPQKDASESGDTPLAAPAKESEAKPSQSTTVPAESTTSC